MRNHFKYRFEILRIQIWFSSHHRQHPAPQYRQTAAQSYSQLGVIPPSPGLTKHPSKTFSSKSRRYSRAKSTAWTSSTWPLQGSDGSLKLEWIASSYSLSNPFKFSMNPRIPPTLLLRSVSNDPQLLYFWKSLFISDTRCEGWKDGLFPTIGWQHKVTKWPFIPVHLLSQQLRNSPSRSGSKLADTAQSSDGRPLPNQFGQFKLLR